MLAPAGMFSVCNVLPPFPPTLNVVPVFVLKVTETSQRLVLKVAETIY